MGFMDRVKKAAESAQAATSKVGAGASSDQMALANRGKRLMERGVETPAHILAMTPTGKTDTPGGQEHLVKLRVTPATGAPYEVTVNQYIYPSAPFAEGEDVIVRVDPEDPDEVMLWDKGE